MPKKRGFFKILIEYISAFFYIIYLRIADLNRYMLFKRCCETVMRIDEEKVQERVKEIYLREKEVFSEEYIERLYNDLGDKIN